MALDDSAHILVAWLLAAARAGPMAWSIPSVGGVGVPFFLRPVVAVGLSLLCLPVVAPSSSALTPPELAVLASREIVVGVTLAFVCACMFHAAASAGHLMDTLHGSSGAGGAAGAQASSAPVASLMLLLFAVVFFRIDGPAHIVWALESSYEAVPLPRAAFGRATLGPAVRVLAVPALLAPAKLIESALGLAAPILAALLLADVALGILGRAVWQLPIVSAGAPLKSLVLAALLLLGLAGLEHGLKGSLSLFFGILHLQGSP